MATPDQIRRRGRWSLVIGIVLAALMLGAVVASGAELVTAEVDGTANDVTVTQGSSANFTIKVSATGNVSCAQTSGSPSTAKVNTSFAISNAGVLASSTPSSALDFWATTPCGGTNGPVTWTGAPTPYSVAASVSAGSSTPIGSYTIALSSAAGTTSETNPNATGGKLEDSTATAITVHVVAPADTTPPIISYALTPGSPDGNNGWYRSNVALVWTVTEAESPGSLAKTGCLDQSITTDQDATTYSCSATSSGGSAGPVSVTIKRDATAPSAETTLDDGPNGSNDWYTTAPDWTTDGEDGLSGLVTDPCQTGTYSGPEGTGLTVSGTCTDNAGNSTSDDSPTFKFDATGPSAALSVTAGTLGDNDWYTSDVTVETNGTDAISGPVTCTAPQFQTTETTGQVFNGSCTNDAGLATNAAPLTVKLDKTGPSASLAVTAGTLGGSGWYRTDVTVSTTGIDSISNPTACTGDQSQTTSTDGEVFNGSCTNNAGLTTNAAPLTVKLDKVAPTLAWAGGPANGASYYFGSVPAAPTCTSIDPLYSGPAGCTVDGYSSVVGSNTMTATALDVAGNSHSETRSYTVLAWTLTGFFQPVDMNGVFNVVKNGSTVPLKFRIFAGSTELTDVANVASLRYGEVTCNASAPADDIETTATGGTSLRYDSTGGQFIYNWKTPGFAGRCYSVTMTALDGSMLSAYFRLK